MTTVIGWHFVDHAEVLAMHAHAIAKWGGKTDPIPVDGCVEGSIGNAQTAAMYLTGEDEPDLLTAVAHLLRSIAKNHCFTDGNKRVAWMSAIRCLLLNDLAIMADEQEAIDLVDGVVTDKFGVREITDWLAAHLVGAQELV